MVGGSAGYKHESTVLGAILQHRGLQKATLFWQSSGRKQECCLTLLWWPAVIVAERSKWPCVTSSQSTWLHTGEEGKVSSYVSLTSSGHGKNLASRKADCRLEVAVWG